jgi:hypothetical protein
VTIRIAQAEEVERDHKIFVCPPRAQSGGFSLDQMLQKMQQPTNDRIAIRSIW